MAILLDRQFIAVRSDRCPWESIVKGFPASLPLSVEACKINIAVASMEDRGGRFLSKRAQDNDILRREPVDMTCMGPVGSPSSVSL